MGITIKQPSSVTPVTQGNDEKAQKPSSGSGELGSILKQISKEKGDKVWMQANKIPDCKRIPTGVFEFDLATGGGFPEGRLSIVYGPESSGKTNICYKGVAHAQKRPAPCNKVVWVDLEGTFDATWAQNFGIDVDELIVVKPGYGEEAVDIIDALVRADDLAMLVVDSIAVLTSAREVDQTTEKFDVGTAAVLVKRLSNKLAIAFAMEARRNHYPAVVFINQTRFKIGVMFGNPETMPGGQTMKFLASLVVRLSGKNKIEKTIHPQLPAYKETKAEIKKAKVAVCQDAFEYDMCLLPQQGLRVGDSNCWGTVSNHLKAFGILAKAQKGQGWEILGESFPTLIPIQDRYLSDHSYRLKLQSLAIEQLSGKKFLVEAEASVK